MIDVEPLADVDAASLRHVAAADVHERVQEIVSDVARRGADAVLDWTRRLDGVRPPYLWLPPDRWQRGMDGLGDDVKAAIDHNHRRIAAFHATEADAGGEWEVIPGLRLGRMTRPVEAACCYVPGGRASYPSTALMTVTPAARAGVGRIIVATPPQADGGVDPAVLYAASLAGATDILVSGGAQAIAHAVYGSEQVPPVDVVVGPGNAYVTHAKQMLQDRVRIDAPAGPTELLVIADTSADPAAVAVDLAAQAEHAPDAQVILVTTDEEVADAVAQHLRDGVPDMQRRDIIEASLQDHGRILVASDLAAAAAFSDAYAPEHLALMVADPRALLRHVHNAGSVFLGHHSPVSLGDYGSGTNHVLPTMGHARRRGGLRVDDFRKTITWQEATSEGMAAIAHDITTLARHEGLHAHAQAVDVRSKLNPLERA